MAADNKLETFQDLRDLGTHIAVAFRNSDRVKSAAGEFYKWQNHGPNLIGPIACGEDREKRMVAVQLLGELRTEATIPYLEQVLRTTYWMPTNDLLLTTMVSIFRSESYKEHKIIRKIWKGNNFLSGFAKCLQGPQSNLSWRFWSKFKCSYPDSIKSSDEGVDHFNRQEYAWALMDFSDAVRLYPYYSGYWRQMGDTKVRMAKDGKKSDYDSFRNWWKIKGESETEVKKRLIWGGKTDLNIAKELAPFLASDLVDIGYGFAMADEYTGAIICYDQALTLYAEETTKAYIHFRRAEAYENSGLELAALSDYEKSKDLNEKALDKIKSGREIIASPYSLENMISDIDQRIQRLKNSKIKA